MEAAWHFYELVLGQKIREAVQEEFFSADVIRGAADALVREGIQNSLDAAESASCVRINISLGELAPESDKRAIETFFGGSWKHFSAHDSGLKSPPKENEPSRFIAFEDFGTSGLTGDPAQYLPIPNVENRFFHFFRVEGRSDKAEGDRGRWGIGKQVFPKASKAKCVFGYTIRYDDQRPLLMAQAILRAHYVSNQCYQDGWFGVKDPGKGVLPVEDRTIHERFCKTFQLTRKDEPGLSLVVPFLHDEITAQEIIAAVLRGYFFPILAGELEVTLRSGRHTVSLTSGSLEQQLKYLDPDIRDEIKPLIAMAVWARDNRDSLTELAIPSPDDPLLWSEGLVTEQIRSFVRDKLQTRETFGLRIPLMVRPRERGKPQRPSHFDLFLMRDDKYALGRPVYVREGIIVPDVRGGRARGIRSLVIVDRGPLGTLLGDSENPSHTQWQKDGSNFKEKYYRGPSYIKFVVDSVAETVRISTQADDDEDKSLLADIFSLPPLDDEDGIDEEQEEESSAKRGKMTEIPKPSPDGRARFTVQRVEGGFTIRPATDLPALSVRIRIRAAYDVRRGNAFSKYNPTDFTLSELSVELEGGRITSKQDNVLVVEAETHGFFVTVRGFDRNRDVRVSANVIREQSA